MRDRNQTKRVLPGAISDKFGTLAVEMRKMPRHQNVECDSNLFSEKHSTMAR